MCTIFYVDFPTWIPPLTFIRVYLSSACVHLFLSNGFCLSHPQSAQCTKNTRSSRASQLPVASHHIRCDCTNLVTTMSTESRQLSSRGTSHTGSTPRPQATPSSRESSRRGPGAVVSTPRGPIEPQYTVYIRLPFPRNGFVDPPRVSLRQGGGVGCGLTGHRSSGMRQRNGICGRLSREGIEILKSTVNTLYPPL